MQNLPFDPILLVGAALLLWLGALGLFDAERLFRVYKMDRRWREAYPEQPKDWPSRARRHGIIFAVGGLTTLLVSWVVTVI